jgi:hypothetical protein
VSFAGLLIGCASGPEVPWAWSVPVVGTQEEWQKSLYNSVEVAGKSMKLQFGDQGWIATVDGTPVMGGTSVSELDQDGSAGTVTLTLTHVYSTQQNPATKKAIGWVEAPTTGQEFGFRYTADPPGLTPQ